MNRTTEGTSDGRKQFTNYLGNNKFSAYSSITYPIFHTNMTGPEV